MRIALARLLKSHGLHVMAFANGEELLTVAAARTPRLDCLVLDLHMPDLTGFDVLARLAEAAIALPVIVFTGHDEPGNAARVAALGAKDYLLKPIDGTALLAAIGRAIDLPSTPPFLYAPL